MKTEQIVKTETKSKQISGFVSVLTQLKIVPSLVDMLGLKDQSFDFCFGLSEKKYFSQKVLTGIIN